MELAQKIKKVKTEARKLARLEMQLAAQTAWHSTSQRDLTVAGISGAYNVTCTTLDKISETHATKNETREAEAEIKLTMIDMVSLIIKTSKTPSNRLAKLNGLKTQRNDRKLEIQSIESIDENNEYLVAANTLTKVAKTAAKQVYELAKNPLKYYDLAQKVWNKHIYRVAKFYRIPIFNRMKMADTNRFIDLLKADGVGVEHFRALSVVAGVVFAALLVTTVVLETVANSHDWSSKLPGTLLATGGSLLLSEVITGPAIASLLATVTSSFSTLAAITAEIPPVALALLAAGVVVVAGIGITALYQFMVDCFFGPSEIPESLRVEISHPMFNQLYHSMNRPLHHEMG